MLLSEENLGGEYKLVPAKVKALLDMGYKPIYELTTESGRAINTTGNHPYLTPEGWVKVSELKQGDEIAVPDYYEEDNKLINSEVEYTLTSFCFLNAFSSDQIAQLRNNASAKYDSSLECGDILEALDRNLSYLDLEMILISSFNNKNNSENSASLMPENFFILPLSDNSSLITNSGESNSQSRFNSSSIRRFLTESGLKNENNMLASMMSWEGNIFYKPCLLATLSFNSSANLFACSSVNLDFEEISSANVNLTLLTNCLTTLSNADLNSSLSSDGTSILITISSMGENNNDNYLKLSNSDIFFDKIVSIKQHPAQHVYDLMIEGTHNFIANDIVAHNTYLGDTLFVDSNSNKVGIGTTSPAEKLEVAGRISLTTDPDSADDVGDRGYNDIRYEEQGVTCTDCVSVANVDDDGSGQCAIGKVCTGGHSHFHMVINNCLWSGSSFSACHNEAEALEAWGYVCIEFPSDTWQLCTLEGVL